MRLRSGRAIRPVEAAVESTSRIGEQYEEIILIDDDEEEIEINVSENSEDINVGTEVEGNLEEIEEERSLNGISRNWQGNLPIDETVDLDISEEEIENNVDEINEDINIGAEVQENLELDESVSNETIDLTDSPILLTPNIASSAVSPSSTSMKCPICKYSCNHLNSQFLNASVKVLRSSPRSCGAVSRSSPPNADTCIAATV